MTEEKDIVEELQEEVVEEEAQEEVQEERVLDIEEAKALLADHEQKRLEEFGNKLHELMREYNVNLTAAFVLFGQVIDPPIRGVPARPQ